MGGNGLKGSCGVVWEWVGDGVELVGLEGIW